MRGRLTLVFALLSGCVSTDTHTHTNTGELCFKSTETGSVEMVVTFPDCLSSSCDEEIQANCHVVEKNGTIVVEGFAEVESQKGGSCTADCGSLTAKCESAPIAPGTYPVAYGANMGSLTLPTEGQVLFEGQSGFAICP
ncbi:MAG TPA: hypothetical protein VGK73_36855 [Polyangiaceae bacterium]